MKRDYGAAVEALNRLQTNWSVIEEIHKAGKKLRDEDLVPEMLEWTRRIGYHPRDFNKMNVIHVTGTKGKGSTCAFTQSLLRTCDPSLKVGLYTSPHLKSVRERIMIDGEPIGAEKFAKYFFQVFDKLDSSSSDIKRFPRMGPGIKPSYFRYLTLVSLHAFMQEQVNSAIYEVGIGGEYDSTNVFDKPVATAVTSLGIDHVNVLGSTIEQIAWNKAGIFKPGVPAFTINDQPKAGMAVLKARALEKGTELTVVEPAPSLDKVNLGLKGDFQRKNAAIACNLVATRLGIHLDAQSLPSNFVKGLESTGWPGRCQTLQTSRATWYIDGAHTVESLEAAANWFGTVIDPSKPVSLLFNQQKRDNVDELLRGLFDKLSAAGIRPLKVYFSTNQSFASGYQPDMVSHNVSKEQVDKLTIQTLLAKTWRELDPEADVRVCSNLEEVANDATCQVLATGSLLMIGGLLAVID